MSARLGLTTRQRQLLDFIESETLADRSPTYDEMKAHLGITSKSSIHRLVAGLVERGRLLHKPRATRSLALPGREPPLPAGAQRVTFTIPAALVSRLDLRCRARRLDANDVVREALDEYLGLPL